MDTTWLKGKDRQIELIKMMKAENEVFLVNTQNKLTLLVFFTAILAVFGIIIILLSADYSAGGVAVGITFLIISVVLLMMTIEPSMDKTSAKEWKTRFDILSTLLDISFIQEASKILNGRSVDNFEANILCYVISINLFFKNSVFWDDERLTDEFLKVADKIGIGYGSNEDDRRERIIKLFMQEGWGLIYAGHPYKFKECLSCALFEGLVDSHKGEPIEIIRENMLNTLKNQTKYKHEKGNLEASFTNISQLYSESVIFLCQEQTCVQRLSQIIIGKNSGLYAPELSKMLIWLETEKSHVLSNLFIGKTTQLNGDADDNISLFTEMIEEHSDTFKELFNEWTSNIASDIPQDDTSSDPNISHPADPNKEFTFGDFVLN